MVLLARILMPDAVENLRRSVLSLTDVFDSPQRGDSSDATLVRPRTRGAVGGLKSAIGAITLFRRCQCMPRVGHRLPRCAKRTAILAATKQSFALHGTNEAGDIISQNDGPLFRGNYPPQYWRSGQTLRDEATLELAPGITNVVFGLYDPRNGRRLPVQIDGRRDDRVVMPLENSSCAP